MSDDYLAWRGSRIDYTEYYDILYGLKSLGATRGDRIYELCAGSGGLIAFLRSKGYANVSGCDIRSRGIVEYCDLEKGLPENVEADYFVFQHCLEHISQESAKKVLSSAVRRSKGVVGILPGHMVGDPTHVVNHYHLEDVIDLAVSSGAEYVYVGLDMASYVHPESRDWIIILSHKPFRVRRPLWFIMVWRFMRFILGVMTRWIHR